jgi:hypothetical protein
VNSEFYQWPQSMSNPEVVHTTRFDSENFGRRCGVSVGATASALVDNVQTPALTLAVEDQKALWVTTAVTTVAFTTQTVVPNGGNIVHIHTITLPLNCFSAKMAPASIFVPVSRSTAKCVLTPGTLTIVCATEDADLPVGASKITFAAGELAWPSAAQVWQ